MVWTKVEINSGEPTTNFDERAGLRGLNLRSAQRVTLFRRVGMGRS